MEITLHVAVSEAETMISANRWGRTGYVADIIGCSHITMQDRSQI